jgi:hypothetical protein
MNRESIDKDIESLERFIYRNEQLVHLEAISNKFNLFDALKISNREIRHSIFLAWLLDPSESHNLEDQVLAELIQTINYISKSQGSACMSVFEADNYNFEDIEIKREWKNIDLLIIDRTKQRYWLIENKIYSGEHSNQLSRYKKVVQTEFPEYKGYYFYLTIDGHYSSDEDYVPISYSVVSEVIDKLLSNQHRYISDDVRLFITHYNEMIKSQIMEESHIQKICRDIYKNHKHALDLIYQYKPDELMNIKEILVDIIERNNSLISEDSNKAYIRFLPKEMDFVPTQGEAWLKSDRILVFEMRNFSSGLKLNLLIGPGDQNLREALYEFMQGKNKIYNRANKRLTKKWFSAYSKDLLSEKDREDLDNEELASKLSAKLEKFLSGDIKKISDDFQKLKNSTFMAINKSDPSPNTAPSVNQG